MPSSLALFCSAFSHLVSQGRSTIARNPAQRSGSPAVKDTTYIASNGTSADTNNTMVYLTIRYYQ
jgi:hypothetical protein